jgi:hypothetical protein
MSDETPKPANKSKRRIPESEIAAALEKHFGNVSHVAKMFGINRSSLSTRIKKSERLTEVVKQARETMVDAGESALYKGILEGNMTAVIFTLKCLGKDRGYIEKQEIDFHGSLEHSIVRLPVKAMNREEWEQSIREQPVK